MNEYKAEAKAKLDVVRARAARVIRWMTYLSAVCLLGAIWGWSYGVGAQLLLTGVLLLLVALFAAGVRGQTASLIKEAAAGHQVQVVRGDGNVQVQGRGNVVMREASNRIVAEPMNAIPTPPRKS